MACTIFKPLAAALALAGCASASADTLLIGNKGEDTVSFVDLGTGRECARVATGKAPHEVAVSPDGRQAAVVAYGATTVDVFDVRTARLVRRIDLAPNDGPHGIVWLTRDRIVVAADRSDTLVILDPRRGTFRSVATGQKRSHMVAVAPGGRLAFTGNVQSGTVSVIDFARAAKLADIPVGGQSEGIALTPDGKELWVGDNGAPHVRVVDAASHATLATLPTDTPAFRVAISPDGKTAVTSNVASGTLNLFDVASRKPLRSIRVSGSRNAFQVTIAFSRDGRRLYVAETGLNTVAEVDVASGDVLRRIPAGKNGDGLGISPVGCTPGA